MWTLECAVGLNVGGALQVTVVTVMMSPSPAMRLTGQCHTLTILRIDIAPSRPTSMLYLSHAETSFHGPPRTWTCRRPCTILGRWEEERHKLLAHHWQDFSNAWMQLHAILAELRYRCTDFLSGCRCLISDIYVGLSLVFSLLICPAIAYSHCTGDTLHWLVWNLAQGSWPMVCSFLPNFSFVILLFCWALLYSTLCLAVLRDTWKVMLSYVQSVWCPCRYICIYIVWTWVY